MHARKTRHERQQCKGHDTEHRNADEAARTVRGDEVLRKQSCSADEDDVRDIYCGKYYCGEECARKNHCGKNCEKYCGEQSIEEIFIILHFLNLPIR